MAGRLKSHATPATFPVGRDSCPQSRIQSPFPASLEHKRRRPGLTSTATVRRYDLGVKGLVSGFFNASQQISKASSWCRHPNKGIAGPAYATAIAELKTPGDLDVAAEQVPDGWPLVQIRRPTRHWMVELPHILRCDSCGASPNAKLLING